MSFTCFNDNRASNPPTSSSSSTQAFPRYSSGIKTSSIQIGNSHKRHITKPLNENVHIPCSSSSSSLTSFCSIPEFDVQFDPKANRSNELTEEERKDPRGPYMVHGRILQAIERWGSITPISPDIFLAKILVTHGYDTSLINSATYRSRLVSILCVNAAERRLDSYN